MYSLIQNHYIFSYYKEKETFTNIPMTLRNIFYKLCSMSTFIYFNINKLPFKCI